MQSQLKTMTNDGNDDEVTITNNLNQDVIRKRRELLDGKLNNYRHDRMKRKLPVDTQLLSCAQEELAVKKKLVDQMDKFEKQYSETMTKLSDNMEKLNNSISEGFSVLKHLVISPPPSPYSYQGHHQYPPTMYTSMSNHTDSFTHPDLP